MDRVQVHAVALEWRAAALALIEEVCLACSPSMLYCGLFSEQSRSIVFHSIL